MPLVRPLPFQNREAVKCGYDGKFLPISRPRRGLANSKRTFPGMQCCAALAASRLQRGTKTC